MKTILHLIRNGSIFFPREEDDHTILYELGIPVNKFGVDYYPALMRFLPKTHAVKLHDFSSEEDDMRKRFVKRWKHEIEITHRSIVLTYPKTVPFQEVEKYTDALKKWYRKHFITLALVTKRSGGRTVKTTLTKSDLT